MSTASTCRNPNCFAQPHTASGYCLRHAFDAFPGETITTYFRPDGSSLEVPAGAPLHWRYFVLGGSWLCDESGVCGMPAKGDWYLDADEWRIW